MEILFLDESEKQKNKNERYFFCLCGLMVDENKLFTLDDELNKLRKNYRFSNLKDLRQRLPHRTKIKRTKEIYEILRSNGAKIISAILGDVALKDINAVDNAYFGALTFLIERFFIHLGKNRKVGIIIFDSVDKTVEKNLRKKSFEFVSKEKHIMYGNEKGCYKEKIYPSILFSDDEHSTILQATDLIATSLNHAVWTIIRKGKINLENLPNENKYLKIYWPLFVKSPAGKVSGWGIKFWR